MEKTMMIAAATLERMPRREYPMPSDVGDESDDQAGPGQRDPVLQMGRKRREERLGEIGIELR